MSTMFIHWIRMKIMASIIVSCHFTTNSRESLHIIVTFDYAYFSAYVHITHINGHTQLWLFVNDRFEFLILQILYIGIFESLPIEQLEIRIYEKRPQTCSNVAMATNIFSQGAPSGIFSENLKKSKLSILEIRTFDSKPTIYKLSPQRQRIDPLTATLFNWNFHSLEVVPRWRDSQLQVSENYSDLTKWRSTMFKYCWLRSRFTLNIWHLKWWYKMKITNIIVTSGKKVNAITMF